MSDWASRKKSIAVAPSWRHRVFFPPLAKGGPGGVGQLPPTTRC